MRLNGRHALVTGSDQGIGQAIAIRLAEEGADVVPAVGAALGAQAGEARLREVITAGGFGHVRRATETPFNMVLEARL